MRLGVCSSVDNAALLCFVLQLAVFEQDGRQTRPELMPMQFSLWHSRLSTHALPGCLVALGSGGAHTQMS